MNRFYFNRHSGYGSNGLVVAVRFYGKMALGAWLGYGKPVWWKPRVIGKGRALWGIGFGWLFLCFRVQVIKLKQKGARNEGRRLG